MTNEPIRSRRTRTLASGFTGLSIALCLGLSGPRPSAAQEPGYEAVAMTPISGDLARTRARTLSDAMARVLEQAVERAAPELRGRLYLLTPRARDYLPTYRILQEGEVDGQFQIRLSAEVDLPRLLRDLQGGAAGTPRKPGARRTVLCATADALAGPAVLSAARAVLGERGEQVEALEGRPCPSDPLQPGDTIFAATRGAATLLVWAAMGGEPAPRAEAIRGTQPPQLGARARGRWLAYPLKSPPPGQPLRPAVTPAEATAFAPTADQAIAEAQRTAADGALRTLLDRQGQLLAGPPGTLVTLEGLGSYAAYAQMVQVLGALPGVLRAEPRRFLPRPPGTGTATAPPDSAAAEDDRVQVFVHTAPDTTAETLGAALGRTPVRNVRLQVVPRGPSELRVLCVAASQLTPDTPPEAETPEPRAADPGGSPLP